MAGDDRPPWCGLDYGIKLVFAKADFGEGIDLRHRIPVATFRQAPLDVPDVEYVGFDPLLGNR